MAFSPCLTGTPLPCRSISYFIIALLVSARIREKLYKLKMTALNKRSLLLHGQICCQSSKMISGQQHQSWESVYIVLIIMQKENMKKQVFYFPLYHAQDQKKRRKRSIKTWNWKRSQYFMESNRRRTIKKFVVMINKS